MLSLEILGELAQQTPTKIVLLVLDGLGGLPRPETGKTELETARTPNLDRLAAGGVCGIVDPVARGITPGSGPGHLGLFGYDPLQFTVGRGVLEALGIDLDLQKGDVAVRGNFCTVDARGLVVDRRAGRITTETNHELCEKLSGIALDGVELHVVPVKEHRLVVVFRGDGLEADVADTDPQQVGKPPLAAVAHSPGARRTADLANDFISKARSVLADSHPANMVLLRGFSQHPDLPTMQEIYKLTPAAIASYPMYRGLAKLAGMKVLKTGANVADEIETLEQRYEEYDFFFLHVKKTDSFGEDGNFDGKVAVLEEVDELLPRITGLGPDVMVVTGDHSTPALLKGHSWHPVPILLHSGTCRRDSVADFSERSCVGGELGRFPATEIMPLAMAHAQKLAKYGA
jgi:2,3-bisphosphoglycerate-independent phosphoglycerate mutase